MACIGLLSFLLLSGVASAQLSTVDIPQEVIDLCRTLGAQITGKGDPAVLGIVQTDIAGHGRPAPPSIGAVECNGTGLPSASKKFPPPTSFRLVKKGTP
jgi:hypothetical protein